MKTCIICSVIILFPGKQDLFSQDGLLNETFKWNYSVSAAVEVVFNNYDCDTRIETTNSNNVQFELTLNAEAQDRQDLDILKRYFEQKDYKASGSKVEINTRFFKKRNPKGTKTEITLSNGDKITLRSLEYSAVLKIPTTSYLNMDTKYSNIEIADMHQLKIESFDDDIYGNKVGETNDLLINAKYSKLVFKEAGKVVMDVFDCSTTFNHVNDMVISSKYSDFDVEESNNVTIESFDDNFDFGETGNIELTAKYSDFESKGSADITLDLFDCDLTLPVIGDLSIKESKYSNLHVEEVKNMKIITSFDDEFHIKNIGSIEVTESKYSELNIEKLQKKLVIREGFNNKVGVEELASNFLEYAHTGKYEKIRIKVHPASAFMLVCSGSYFKFDISVPDLKITKQIAENSRLELEGIKGTNTDNMPEVKINGFDMDLRLY